MALENKEANSKRLCHGIVRNIPVEFHSADLRSFFSHFIESGGFDCFHYRHRPEVQTSTRTDTTATEDGQKRATCCCIVRLTTKRMNDFVRTYNGQNWIDKNKKCFAKKAIVARVKVKDISTGEHDTPEFQTRKEHKQNLREKVEFSVADLAKLPELYPPPLMPNGNVGTPTSTFLEFIRSCKLPPKIVSKLGLTFLRNKTKKYSNMPFDYQSLDEHRKGGRLGTLDIQGEVRKPDVSGEVSSLNNIDECTASGKCSDAGERILLGDEQNSRTSQEETSGSQDIQGPQTSKECEPSPTEGGDICTSGTETTVRTRLNEKAHTNSDDDQLEVYKTQSQSSVSLDTETEETVGMVMDGRLHKTGKTKRKLKKGKEEIEKSEGQEKVDDDSAEEDWERHEALHNDVDNQARTRERLFEEEIELKWEKGGSGLVFYTDAAFWRQQEEADMDEEMADDWDIDMSVYEEPGSGDKDSRDLLQMRTEEQWRRGNEVDLNRIGGFEKFTKGFGGRLMRQQGWKEGKGLGASQVGRAEPVSADGQAPHSKRGLGYFGEKLERNVQVKRPRADREVKISTIYDEPDERGVNLFQSQGPHVLTYRDNVEFVPASKQRKVE